MKKQALNPILPSWEYIPDGEPHVFGDRLYLFGSHDRFDGEDYCQNNYVCWSCPVEDLSDWTFHGEIYDVTDDPLNTDDSYCGYAPDCCRGPDGKYYLYYALNNHLAMSVAVSDTPAGKYTFLGHVKTKEGRTWGTEAGDAYVFDPGVLVDSDGKVHLYMGFSPTDGMSEIELTKFLKRWNTDGCHHLELCDDMLTIKDGPWLVVPGCAVSRGTNFEGHAFFEAPSIRKFFDKYYFIYSSEHFHELCYAVGDTPKGPFEYKGRLVSNGDIGLTDDYSPVNHIGNNHGSLVCVNNDYYIFYHRHTNNTPYSRQACAERIILDDNGEFMQAELTSCGLNNGPLEAKGEYKASIACNISAEMNNAPYLIQALDDNSKEECQYIKNMTDGSFAGFKYFKFYSGEKIALKVVSSANSVIEISDSINGTALATIDIYKSSEPREFISSPINVSGVTPLYFRYKGEGNADILSFRFL